MCGEFSRHLRGGWGQPQAAPSTVWGLAPLDPSHAELPENPAAPSAEIPWERAVAGLPEFRGSAIIRQQAVASGRFVLPGASVSAEPDGRIGRVAGGFPRALVAVGW